MNRASLDSRATAAGDRFVALLGAALMVVSGLVHLHLWDVAYRHVGTLGPLFLVQTAAAFAGAVLLVFTRMAAVMLASALLMLGTLGGFVLADTVGIFSFKLPEATGCAYLALVAEVLAAAALLFVAARLTRTGRSSPARQSSS
jgi:hypothetical protein